MLPVLTPKKKKEKAPLRKSISYNYNSRVAPVYRGSTERIPGRPKRRSKAGGMLDQCNSHKTITDLY